MAKKQRPAKAPAAETPVTPEVIQAPAAPQSNFVFSFGDFRVQAIILAIIGFVFYFNSFQNEYAHDDGIVIIKNDYVQEGFAGIGKIMTKDAYDSYYKQLNTTNQLSGGRYRPLSIVTFAIEQQFFGAIPEDKIDSTRSELVYGVTGPKEKKLIHDMHIRHVVNVLIYILSVVVLLYFLRKIILPAYPVAAFLAALIFLIHPIHTEVVANVKSRDEIMSLLFICLTFIFAFKYKDDKKPLTLLWGVLSFFLALLSKEYAITLIVLLPLAFYLFRKETMAKSLISFLPYLIPLAGYLALRFSIVAPMGDNSDDEVLNNPYLFASGSQKIASEIGMLLNYIKLLFWPHPLSADYSYNQIPYRDFSSPVVWVSLLVHIGLVVEMFVLFFRRNVLCFAIAFYLLHLALICNIFFDIGATMGERLIYHSSVGFAIIVGYLLYKGYEKIKPAMAGKAALAGVMGLVVVLSGFATIERNADWKNDSTLFLKDVKTVPNSVLANGNAAACYIGEADVVKDSVEKKRLLHLGIAHLDKALSIHTTFTVGYLNRGLAYYKLGQLDKAQTDWDHVKKLYPTYPTLPALYALLADYHLKNGWNSYGKFGNYEGAVNEFKKGLEVDPKNVELWYNMGGAYFTNKQYKEAADAFAKTLQLKPDHKQAQQGYNAAMARLGQMN